MVFVIHWHESAMELHVFPIPIPPPTSLSTRFLWVFPVHQARAFVSCIPPAPPSLFLYCFSPLASPWKYKFPLECLFKWMLYLFNSHTRNLEICFFFFISGGYFGRSGRGGGRRTFIHLSIKCVFANTWFASNSTDLDGKQMYYTH